MLAMEEILMELSGGEERTGLPPGFRFHPTDEELITFYLASKVFHGSFRGGGGVHIAEVDLNRCEPWELPEAAKMGEREWYFFSLRDRKYPTGLRTNRATGCGYWKATGKDREVYTSTTQNGLSSPLLIGMRKTLVFYKGRAPRGEKTKWVMHEYRLDGDFSLRQSSKDEWVICRIFHKLGEKKNAWMLQGQLKSCDSSSSTRMMMQYRCQEISDLKALISPLPSRMSQQQQQHCTPLHTNNNNCCLFEPSFINDDYSSSTSTTSLNTFMKSLLSSSNQFLGLSQHFQQQQQQQQQSNFQSATWASVVHGTIIDSCSNNNNNAMGFNAPSAPLLHETTTMHSPPPSFGRAGGFQMLLETPPPAKLVTSDYSWAF